MTSFSFAGEVFLSLCWAARALCAQASFFASLELGGLFAVERPGFKKWETLGLGLGLVGLEQLPNVCSMSGRMKSPTRTN